MASPLPPTPVGVRVRVPAKINLALKVGAARPDGYHPLATVYHAVSLYDEVQAVWAEPDEFDVQVTGEGADQVPLDDSNLALRAARLLARTHGPTTRSEPPRIRKAIPVAGGLAGGSANGAAALLACSTLWDLDVGPEQLRELAAELGSDVPVRAPRRHRASAAVAARRSCRRWPAAPTTGCWPSATTGCPRPPSTAASTS